ncbi:MAG: hypothetical protein AB7N54_13065 [Alphaproteobacteria bacterium]
MADAVGIVNSALLKIGARATVTALTEGTPNANAAAALYPKVRDDLLRAHAWNFAAARVRLAELAVPPAYGFARAFALPGDWLRTVAVHDSEAGQGAVAYRMEGGAVLSDAAALWLAYVRRVTDANEMTADFRETLALALAVELALPVANSGTLRDRLEATLRRRLRQARGIDAVEDFPPAFPAGSWANVRG